MSTAPAEPDLRQTLARVWANKPGLVGALGQVNHKTIGVRYMVTALAFFVVGGLEALVIRAQLASPNAGLVSPELYNQLFTMHGSTMMFLFVVPFLEGLAIYLVPLMIGTRDMAFPRLNAFGYWVYLFAGLALHVGLLAGVAPDAGWFNYPPLSGPGYSLGPHIDYWVATITLLEVAALAAAVELIVTILRQRAPGMTLSRMPLFVWSALVMAFMIVFAMPPLVVTSLFLGLDRFAGMHFFNVAAGGEPLLWQHLFWFFGHPDVYIMLVPVQGAVSMIVPAFARRPLAGYRWAVLSLVAIGFVSFGLWVHHMYAAGLPVLGTSFFAGASMMITIPSAVLIFAWILTLWRGRLRLELPLLFVIGFLVLLILGGITGIMLASQPFDTQVHDTYFVVAHFHYVLFGGVVFPIFAAIYYWFPKVTGRMLGKRLGHAHFWLFLVGFKITFFPMHLLGFDGMPRRVYTYLPGLGWESNNLLATIGAFILALGALAFTINFFASLLGGRRAGDDPWQAGTLEWATASPPPIYNFAALPAVDDLEPRWTEGPDPRPRPVASVAFDAPGDVRREVLATTALDARPEHRVPLPASSLWPLALAASVTLAFVGAMTHLGLVVVGAALSALALVGWFRQANPAPEAPR